MRELVRQRLNAEDDLGHGMYGISMHAGPRISDLDFAAKLVEI